MFSTSDFITEAGAAAYSAERQDRFEWIACDYLRRTFGPRLSQTGDADLLTFVRRCQPRAAARGIEVECELLRYFAIACILGVEFEHDPQHRPMLETALWIEPDGTHRRVESTGLLWDELGRWFETMQADTADMARLRRAFADLYRDEDRDPDAQWLFAFLADAWPRLYTARPQTAWLDLGNAVRRSAAALKLDGPDLMAVVGLAPYYGMGLLDDPAQPWISAALAMDGRSMPERRLALGNGILSYWTALVEGERA
ncbi:hypothetical protein [Jannaschia aquimarina]|uniref:Uncharacterized protein n=1 Tax=Jannaschia aquimarina TaxID=935700 RepID=A0A0D1DAD9_9RHOB|nr:hypothetical protein [Jannaschia aquimarina]KIT16878.1 hypothetical protein jaqu_13760 [Jannaschia aquimarina]SNT12503.1 hypothetical protein SAMN05421775_10672 [Jannaschia aquimarina]